MRELRGFQPPARRLPPRVLVATPILFYYPVPTRSAAWSSRIVKGTMVYTTDVPAAHGRVRRQELDIIWLTNPTLATCFDDVFPRRVLRESSLLPPCVGVHCSICWQSSGKIAFQNTEFPMQPAHPPPGSWTNSPASKALLVSLVIGARWETHQRSLLATRL